MRYRFQFLCRFRSRSAFHGEPDFDASPASGGSFLFNVAARFDHLKPAQILDGLVACLTALSTASLHGSAGSAGEFDEFINVVFTQVPFGIRQNSPAQNRTAAG